MYVCVSACVVLCELILLPAQCQKFIFTQVPVSTLLSAKEINHTQVLKGTLLSAKEYIYTQVLQGTLLSAKELSYRCLKAAVSVSSLHGMIKAEE